MIGVIGCGNPARSDDGFGCFVVRCLIQDPRTQNCGCARIFDAGTDGMSVMFKARGVQRLIIIDAARTGAAPGTLFDVPGEVLARAGKPSFNLHDFRWEQALFVGRQIFRDSFPQDITVYLGEAASVDFGLSLTQDVERAAWTVAGRVAASIMQYAEQGSAVS